MFRFLINYLNHVKITSTYTMGKIEFIMQPIDYKEKTCSNKWRPQGDSNPSFLRGIIYNSFIFNKLHKNLLYKLKSMYQNILYFIRIYVNIMSIIFKEHLREVVK